MTLCKRANRSWVGITVTLWAGGNPTQAADDVDLTTVGATAIASHTFTDLAYLPVGDMGTAQVATSLNTGTGQTVGSALWVEIKSTGSQQEFFDSVSITAAGNAVLITPAPSGVTNVEPTTILEWAAPSAYTATGYDAYFGTNPNVRSNPKIVDNQLVTTYDPPSDLAWETIYYWTVDSYDGAVKYEGSTCTIETRPEFPPANPLKKGPYLIYTGANTEMQVLWQVENTQNCTVEWGLDASYSTGSVQTSEYGSDHQHSYTISALTPDTKYYYRVYADANYHEGSFITAPDDSDTNVKFLAYGDTRSVPSDQDIVVGQMIGTYDLDPDFQTITLHVGDWINADSETDWTDQFFPTIYDNLVQFKKEVPINGCRGNHEGGGSIYSKYWPYPYESAFYWSFDYGPAHIAIVDQYVSYTPGSAQYIWLENDLASSTKQWKFIVLHEPGWSAGGHANNTTVQSSIQPLCLAYDVDVVFCGHNHYYARCAVDGVQHITTGGGGAPLYAPDQNAENLVFAAQVYQHCEVSIAGDQLDFIARRSDGVVIDSFTISHIPCTAVDCHVNSIICSTEKGGPAKMYGSVTVTVKDNCGDPVVGAQVTGTFTGDYNEASHVDNKCVGCCSDNHFNRGEKTSV